MLSAFTLFLFAVFFIFFILFHGEALPMNRYSLSPSIREEVANLKTSFASRIINKA